MWSFYMFGIAKVESPITPWAIREFGNSDRHKVIKVEGNSPISNGLVSKIGICEHEQMLEKRPRTQDFLAEPIQSRGPEDVT